MVLFQEGQGLSHRLRRFIDNAVCIVLLVVVPLLLLWPALTRGEVPIGVDSVLSFAPWEAARPEVALPIDDASANLMAQRIYPWYAHMASLTSYKDLLWYPLESCGLPFMALWRTRCFSPFSIPFYVLDVLVALQVSILAKLLVAGFCAFYAARRLGFGRPIALFVALSFQMSGHLTLWCVYPISDVIPWLPLIILFCERLALGHPRVWSRGALALALMLLGGDPETLAAVLLFSAVYLALRFALDSRPPRDWLAPVGVFALSFVVALGLAAIQILPFIEFLGESAHGGRAPASYFPQMHDLISAFLPSGFGTAKPATFAEAESRRVAGLLHVGIGPVLMLPVWFSLRRFASTRQRRRIEALLLTATMMLVLAMCARFLTSIPVLRFLNPEHYLAPGAFVMALVAAATVEEWLHLNAEDCMASLRRLLFIGPLFALLAVGVVVAGHQGLSVSMGAYGWKIALDVAIMLVLLIVLGATTLKPSVRLLGYAMSSLTVVDLMLAFGLAMPYTPADRLFPETEFIQLFQQSGGRVGGSEALSQWPLSGNGIPQLYSAAGVALKRHQAFTSRIADDPLLLRRAGASSLLLSQDDVQGKFAPIRPLLKFEKMFPSGAVLFRDLDAKPYAWMAYSGRSVETIDPKQLSSDQPPLMEQAVIPQPPPTMPVPAIFVNPIDSIRTEIRVPATPPGVLVQADAWYPGWKARVNGEPAKMFPVEILFRGIEISKGESDVVIYYDPLPVKIGLGISAASAIVILIGLQSSIRHGIKEMRQKKKWRR